MFPEDWPAEDQHEVRTVEEESLFRLAFPELVESYMRNKALAEENKTKSKSSIHTLKVYNFINITMIIMYLLIEIYLKLTPLWLILVHYLQIFPQ